jgi:hypothetical protein
MKMKLLIVLIVLLTLGACQKESSSSSHASSKVKEKLEVRTNKYVDNSNIIPLDPNPDGTYSGSLMGAKLIFSAIYYDLYDPAGIPIPDRTGDPFYAAVSMAPDNTMGANIVESGDITFTIFFSGYLSGGCNTSSAMQFDYGGYSAAVDKYNNAYNTLINKYTYDALQWLNNPSLPKPVLPLPSSYPRLSNYLVAPTCAQSAVYSVSLIRLEGGGLAMRM